MKKGVILGILAIMLISSVSGGVLYHTNFGNDKTARIMGLEERDAIDFTFPYVERDEAGKAINLSIKKHIIKIDQINNGKGTVDLAAFVEGAKTPFYLTIGNGRAMNLDFERDDIDDMRVELLAIQDNKVDLVFKKIVDSDEVMESELVDNDLITGSSIVDIDNKDKLRLVLYVVLVVLVAILIFNNLKKRNKKEEIVKE